MIVVLLSITVLLLTLLLSTSGNAPTSANAAAALYLMERNQHLSNFIYPYIEYGLITNMEQMTSVVSFLNKEQYVPDGLIRDEDIACFDMQRGLDFERAVGITTIGSGLSRDIETFYTKTEQKMTQASSTDEDKKGKKTYTYWGGSMTESMLKKVVATDLNGAQERVLLGTGMVRYEDKEERQMLWMNLHLYRSEKEHQLLKCYRQNVEKKTVTTSTDIVDNKYDIHVAEMDVAKFQQIVGKDNAVMLEWGPQHYAKCLERVRR